MNKQYSDRDEYERADHERSKEAINLVGKWIAFVVFIIVSLPVACQMHQTIYAKPLVQVNAPK